MKKLGAALAVIVLLGLVLTFWLTRQSPEPELAPVTVKGPGPSDDSLYDLDLKIVQESEGQTPQTLIALQGEFEQAAQGPERVSRWTAIQSMTYGGQLATPAQTQPLINKPLLSVPVGGEWRHHIGSDFPKEFLPFHLNLLQKLFVPESIRGDTKEVRTEADEIGSYKLDYTSEANDQGYAVRRTWLHYGTDGVKVDAVDNTLRYQFNNEGRLLALEGQITLHYRQGRPLQFTTFYKARLKSTKPAAAQRPVVTKDALPVADQQRVAQVIAEVQRSQIMTQEEALEKLSKVDETTESTEVYDIFTSLKSDLIRSPEHLPAVLAIIRGTKGRSEADQRRLSVLFGALAQSQAPEIANALVDLSRECPDNFCKIQALVALNDHPSPSVENAEAMLEMSRGTSDSEVASTALLTAGAMGHKLGETMPQLSEQLVQELNDPSKDNLKGAVLAAMGNHGSNAYLPVLQSYIEAKDPSLQGAAAYSLRYVEDPTVNGTLLGIVQKSQDPGVAMEALKAMEYRQLSGSDTQRLAEQAPKLGSAQLQQAAARVVIGAYREQPEANKGALETLKTSIQDPSVKAYIEGETKPETPPAGSQP